MGRRSINTTKSGKYMNPTDQARKEARKKELKKNKRQRQLVRAAVLKGKDPSQIIEEMEKIDQMEYNVMQPPPLNEKVLKDKRKKLKETLDRVLKMFAKDDQEKWTELKDQMIQYERRRLELVSYFEAVRHAQQVQVDEIPLPSSGNQVYTGPMTAQIPLPEMPPMHSYPHAQYYPQHHPLANIPVPPSILKKTSIYTSVNNSSMMPTNRDPPGVPPYPPPDIFLSDDEDDDRTKSSHKSKTIRFADEDRMDDDEREDLDGKEIDKDKEKDAAKKPTTLQQKMLVIAGQNIDQYMKDIEVAHKKRKTERAQDLNARLSLLDSGDSTNQDQSEKNTSDVPAMPAPQPPMSVMGLPPPPPLMYRPSAPPLHLRMPPPPPPRHSMGIRLPPGPPPGMPRMMRPGGPMPMPRVMGPMGPTGISGVPNAQKTPNVLTAAPQLINSKKDKESGKTTIEAKPQIRNLAADVTRFVPTSIRVKRIDDKKKPSVPTPIIRIPERMPPEPPTVPKPVQQPKTKDDAYMQFMAEMQSLL